MEGDYGAKPFPGRWFVRGARSVEIGD